MPGTSQRAQKFLRLLFKRRVQVPREIQLEVTNRCNLDCDMCPRITLLGVPERDMSRATFDTVLSRLRDPEAITLTGWGEPLMHPELFDFMREINERFPRCELGFTTNGFLLSDKNIAQIAERRLSQITLSLEELPWEEQAQDHAQARELGLDPKKGHNNALAREGHPSSGRVIEGIRALIKARDGLKEPFKVRLQVVLMPEGSEIVRRLIDFAADEGIDQVNLVRLDVRGRPDLARPSWEQERVMIAEARAHCRRRGVVMSSVNDHGALMKMASHRDSFCMRLDNYVYVDVDGHVAPCCLLRGEHTGDLREQSLEEVWQGEAMMRFYGPTLPEPCHGCDAFMNSYSPKASSQALSV